MTTQTLIGTYSSGYTLSAGYSNLTVAGAGLVVGATGLGAQGAQGGNGGAGLYVAAYPSGRTVYNGGTIVGGIGGYGTVGGAGGDGLFLAGGVLANSGAIRGGAGGTGNYAYGAGGAGVYLSGGVVALNAGSITGGAGGAGGYGDGVVMVGGGTIVNAIDARISGGTGIYAAATGSVTVTNYGVIQGSGGTAVQFGSSSDRLVAEAGSTFFGVVRGGGGALELAAGVGNLTGLGSTGSASGPESVAFAGFESYQLDAGGAWTLSGSNALAAGQTLTNLGALTLAGSLNNGGVVVSGVGLALSPGGAVTNDASGVIAGVMGIYTAATGAVTVTNYGVIQGSGGTAVLFGSSSDRLVAEAGSSFLGTVEGGGGALELAAGIGNLTGLGSLGTAFGSDSLTFSGFGSYQLDAGGAWALSGSNAMAAGQTLTNLGVLTLSGSLNNAGVIAAGVGLALAPGATVTNDAGGVITGVVGIYTAATGAVTVTNYGVIQGTGGTAVQFGSSSDRLVAGAGSTFFGVVRGGGGALELAAGIGNLTGLGSLGTAFGSDSLTFSGFGSYQLDAGGAWTLSGSNALAAGQTLTNLGALTVSGSLNNAGVIIAAKAPGSGHSRQRRSNPGVAGEGVGLTSGGDVINAAGGLISGLVGVYADATGPATVTNLGTIQGANGISVQFMSAADKLIVGSGSTFLGVVVGGGGTLELTPGATSVTGLGSAAAVASGGQSLTFSGFGTYLFDTGGTWNLADAAVLKAGQTLNNFGSLVLSGALVNAGEIDGGPGLSLAGGASVTNSAGGLISGLVGIYAGAAGSATVTNFGTIHGANGASVQFKSGSDRLIAGSGSTFVGAVVGGGGTLELAGGSGTLSGLGATLTLSGGVAMTATAFGSYVLDAGGAWILAGADSLAAGRTLASRGSLSVTGSLLNAGTITIGAASAGLTVLTGAGVTNGAPTATSALISSYFDGVYAVGPASVSNFGSIVGQHLDGVQLALGGGVVNGATNAAVALIAGAYVGVYAQYAVATVSNFGTITGKYSVGVQLGSGGAVANGNLGSTLGVIAGYFDGVYAGGAATVANYGTIQGANLDGVLLTAGGKVVNGGAGSTNALISGATVGVYNTNRAAAITNLGSIVGVGFTGVFMGAGGGVTNGSAASVKAVISGYIGVYAGVGSSATVTNFGTIAGTSGKSVKFKAAADRLIVGKGSTFIGAASGGGGALELAAAVASIKGLGSTSGKVSGGEALTFSGFGSYTFDKGGVWTLAGAAVLATKQTLTNLGSLTVSGSLNSAGVVNSGSGVVVAAGGAVTNSAGGLITGTIGVYAGASGAVTVTNFGTISGTGAAAVQFKSAGDRLIDEAGSSIVGTVLGGGGTLELAAGVGTISGLGQAFSGFAAYGLDAGASWTLAGTDALAAGRTLTSLGTLTVSGSVTNAGLIAAGAGLRMAAGGMVANVGGGVISGVSAIYAGATSAATVTNFGTLQGTGGVSVQFKAAGDRLIAEAGSTCLGVVQGGGGVLELAGGSGTIAGLGSSGNLSGAEALTFSGFGAYVIDAGGLWTLTGSAALSTKQTLTNLGSLTVSGSLNSAGVVNSGSGVVVAAGGAVTNSAGGLISGTIGVYAGATGAVTVTNFGTISGTGAAAVQFKSAGDRLIAQAGSTVVGAVQGGGGTLELASGTGTITGAGSTATLTGSDSMTFGGFSGLVIDAGTTWALGGSNTFSAGGTIAIAGALTISGVLSGGCTLSGAAASVITFKKEDMIGGTLLSATSVTAAGVGNVLDGTAGTLTNQASLTITTTGVLTIQGAIANTAKIILGSGATANALTIGTPGATLSGHGTINLGTSNLNILSGAVLGATLTNIDNTINGSGFLGNGVLTLINQASGLIDQTGAQAMLINTGAATIANAGTIESTGVGGATVLSAIANAGLLEANGGNLTINAAVNGSAGSAFVSGATLTFTSTFSQNVKFGAAGGALVLASSRAYSGTITGFSTTGATSFDLRDIAFTGAGEAKYSGTKTGGVLTVSDGVHTATIRLTGNYLNSSWIASSDGVGGTVVVDPRALAGHPPSPQSFAASMATVAFGAPSVGAPSNLHPLGSMSLLIAPRS